MPKFSLMVLTNPVEGREDEFNDWYTKTHLDDVLKVPGIVGAQRFRRTQRDPGSHPWKYTAIYQCEAEDVGAVIGELKARSGTAKMPLSGAMNKDAFACFFEPITEMKRPAG